MSPANEHFNYNLPIDIYAFHWKELAPQNAEYRHGLLQACPLTAIAPVTPSDSCGQFPDGTSRGEDSFSSSLSTSYCCRRVATYLRTDAVPVP